MMLTAAAEIVDRLVGLEHLSQRLAVGEINGFRPSPEQIPFPPTTSESVARSGQAHKHRTEASLLHSIRKWDMAAAPAVKETEPRSSRSKPP